MSRMLLTRLNMMMDILSINGVVRVKTPYASYIECLLPSSGATPTNLITAGKLPGGPIVTTAQALDLIFQPGQLTAMRTDPNNRYFLAAKKNDLFRWNPKAPALLCHGSQDPLVSFALSQVAIKADFDSRGLTNVVAVDVDPLVQTLFELSGRAPTGPTSVAFATYYGSYHTSYAVGLCVAQARAFFDTKK